MLRFLGGLVGALIKPWLFVLGAFLMAGPMLGQSQEGPNVGAMIAGFVLLAVASQLGEGTASQRRRRHWRR